MLFGGSGSCVCVCMCAVNQCGVIHQPLAMVCPASVDLKPDGYLQQTQSCIPQTEETENRSQIMYHHTVTCRKRGGRKMHKFLIGPFTHSEIIQNRLCVTYAVTKTVEAM